MTQIDIRWKQRLNNFSKALAQLEDAVKLTNQRALSDLEKQGLIQAFEFTHELYWNVVRDYFIFQGNSRINGSRDATREAFQMGLIANGDQWMEMIKSRNQSSHTYNKSVANEIVEKVTGVYFSLFKEFAEKMATLAIK